MILKGRSISKGIVEGEVLTSKEPLSFLGGVDPRTGIIRDNQSSAYGKTIKNKILVFPRGKGSTVGSYVMLQLKKNNVAPKGIINAEAETIITVGAIISKIPMIDMVDISVFKDGQHVRMNANTGEVEIIDF